MLFVLGFPSECKTEVRWMFGHLDRDTDARLSIKDLYSLGMHNHYSYLKRKRNN